MARTFSVIALACTVTLNLSAQAPRHIDIKDAMGASIGMAMISAKDGGIAIDLDVKGLTPGEHAVHIHSVAKCEGPGFTTAGPHFNPAAKKHGLQHWIEGPFVEEGTPVAIVDDVLTSGGSMITAIERVRAAGAEVVSALVVIDREEDEGRAKVEAELGGAPLHALFTARELLAL